MARGSWRSLAMPQGAVPLANLFQRWYGAALAFRVAAWSEDWCRVKSKGGGGAGRGGGGHLLGQGATCRVP